MRGSPPPHPTRIRSPRTSRTSLSRRACQKGESPRRRRDIAESRAQFREYAMRGSPPPHPARLGSPRASHTSLSTASVSKGESPKRRHDIAESRAQFREYAMRGSPTPHPTRLGSLPAKYAPLSTVITPKKGTFDALARKSPRQGRILRIHNATQSTATSRSAPVSTHQPHIALHGEHTKRGNLRGVVVISPSRGPNFDNTQCEAAQHCIPLGSRL